MIHIDAFHMVDILMDIFFTLKEFKSLFNKYNHHQYIKIYTEKDKPFL